MRPNEYKSPTEHDLRRGARFELFYFEQVGARSYLRFTRLALLLVVGLTVVSAAMLFALFLWNIDDKPEDINLNITVPPAARRDYGKPFILPAPLPSSPPRVIQRRMPAARTPRLPLDPTAKDGKLPTPSTTTSPTPTRPPTGTGM
jgi:hypothetical protein